MSLVTIVVSMYNSRQFTLDIIDRLFFPGLISNASSDKQLVLLDDCSPAREETEALIEKYRPELAKRFGDIQIVRNGKNLGFARSHNKGIEAAECDTLLLVNSDIYLTRGVVDSLALMLSENGNYGLVGPVSNYQASFQNTSLFPELSEYSPGELEKAEKFAKWLREVMGNRRYKLPDSGGMGSCFAVKKGPETYFDERFGYAFSEDIDLNERMLKSGYKLIVDASTYVYHHGSASTCQHKFKATYACIANQARFLLKWGDPLKFFGERRIGFFQKHFDIRTVTSHIIRHAKEMGLWEEYLQEFKKQAQE